METKKTPNPLRYTQIIEQQKRRNERERSSTNITDLAHDAKQVFFKGPLIRLYANLPLILSLGNALSIVEQFFQTYSSKSFNGQSYCEFKNNEEIENFSQCYNYDTDEYQPQTARYYVTCPYQTDSLYIGILNAFSGYYCLLIAAKVIWLLRFSTSDVRYYLASDRFATTNINRLLHYIGILLVAAFAALGIFVAVVLVGNTSGVGNA